MYLKNLFQKSVVRDLSTPPTPPNFGDTPQILDKTISAGTEYIEKEIYQSQLVSLCVTVTSVSRESISAYLYIIVDTRRYLTNVCLCDFYR
jgi:hypothetical protein